MFLVGLLILTLLSFVFLHHPTFILAHNFYTPNPPVDNIANDNFLVFDNNLPIPATTSPPVTRQLVFPFNYSIAIANGVIIIITLILVYKLRQLQDTKFAEQTNLSSLSFGQLCRRFSLLEIQSATSNFDDALVIGQGGFGKVYRGIIDFGASTVAIKRLKSKSKQGAPEFWTEIEMLSKFRHSNLVSLIGYCNDCGEMILVYEYMPHGTLADHLHKSGRNGDTSPLSWVQRLNICIGGARGLDYLHTGTSIQQRVIHRDVKSTNILLDENLAAKISDFGMSKIGPANQAITYVSTNVKGTFGYMDPEYLLTQRLTRKSDVYAFGVVLFEVLCGRKAVDCSLDEEQRGLAGWAQHCIKEGILDQIIDPSMKGKILPNSLMEFVRVANQCLHGRPKHRPTMAEVVVDLESALALQESTDYSLVEWDNGHQDEQPPTKPAKKTFITKVQLFLSVTTRGISEHIKNNNNRGDNSMLLSTDGVVLQEVGGEIVTPNLRMFTLAELRRATRNFSSVLLLGEGYFGRVFKCWVHEKTYAPSRVGVGMAIAVKRRNPDSFQGLKELQTEVKVLGKFSHPNLVKLLGVCIEDEELLLVYEYAQEGSLDTHLFNKIAEPLSWVVRLKILIGAARCLAFFHTTEKQLIYRDFKSANILLDGEFNAKLSGVGMARLGPVNGDTHVSTRVIGTYGYAAPEYMATGHLYVKSDVFGFGVLLLEVLTGKRATDKSNMKQHNLVEWAKPFLTDKRKVKKVLDPLLEHDHCPKQAILSAVAALVLKCLHSYPSNRPSMVEVLVTLEQINAMEM